MIFRSEVSSGGLTVVAHAGNNTVLLGMSLSDEIIKAHGKILAGFAIWRKEAGYPEQPVLNRIGFDNRMDAAGTASFLAPIQQFRWLDVPPKGFHGLVTYRVQLLFFSGKSVETTGGPQVQLSISPVVRSGTLSVGFTRGMFSALAREKWLQKVLRPSGRRQFDFDTKPFQEAYEWLGGGARRLLFDFLTECVADKSARVDVIAFDLDEPDIVAMLCRLGRRLRVIVDDNHKHVDRRLKRKLTAAGARVFLNRHSRFLRYRAIIKIGATGKPLAVLFGSTDFALHGLYAHPNNVFVSEDPQIACAFAAAFECFLTDPPPEEFRRTPIAEGYVESSRTAARDEAPLMVAFGPHRSPETSLNKVANAIRTARQSVLFSVTDSVSNTGAAASSPLLESLKEVAERTRIFSYGIAQIGTRLAVQNPEGEMSRLRGLRQIEPEAFRSLRKTWQVSKDVAFGQRFVIVDFDTDHSSVFVTSSNFGAGAGRWDAHWVALIRDPAIVHAFMVEGIRQIDHYDFRQKIAARRSRRLSSLGAAATAPSPTLWHPGLESIKPAWWEPYYDPSDVNLRDRHLFAHLPISDAIQSRKRPDWTSLDAPAARKRAARGRTEDEASRLVASGVRGGGETSGASQVQKPRWILANVLDLSAADRKKPTPAFRAGAPHEIRVIIGAEQEDWLVARGRDASESIDSMLPKGTHELTVVFFIPVLGIHQTGKLTLPPSGPSPEPATFRFEVGAAGTSIVALISIVHRGRVLQTALLSGKAVANPLRAPDAARITLRLQVVVPGFADLDRREVFDAALVTATGATNAAVAAGVVHSAGPGKTVFFDQPRIDSAARAIRTVLEEVVTDDSIKGKLDSEAARTLLWKLAQEGRILYEYIGERLEKELSGRDLSHLQLVQADPGAFIPIEFAYGLPPPANGAGLCKNWKGALAGNLCTADHHRMNALGHLKVVCPSGFWSMSKVIERQVLKDLTNEEMRKSDFGVRAEPSAERPKLPPIGSALFAWSDILDNTVRGTSAGVLKSLNQATREHAAAVKTWLEWAEAIDKHQPGLLVLLSHTVDDALEIGPEKSGETATLAQINSKFVKKLAQDAPVVFLLGCTTGVADDKLVSFVGRFRDQGAALVVGTITPVLGERSAAVVKAVVAKLAQKRTQPARFGELMRDARRDLLSRGELTALCATSFGDASWLVS